MPASTIGKPVRPSRQRSKCPSRRRLQRQAARVFVEFVLQHLRPMPEHLHVEFAPDEFVDENAPRSLRAVARLRAARAFAAVAHRLRGWRAGRGGGPARVAKWRFRPGRSRSRRSGRSGRRGNASSRSRAAASPGSRICAAAARPQSAQRRQGIASEIPAECETRDGRPAAGSSSLSQALEYGVKTRNGRAAPVSTSSRSWIANVLECAWANFDARLFLDRASERIRIAIEIDCLRARFAGEFLETPPRAPRRTISRPPLLEIAASEASEPHRNSCAARRSSDACPAIA